MAKKDCMFQYATVFKYVGTEIYHNTDLITLEEAKNLWRESLPKFIEELQNGATPEMVIWINCKDDSDYGDELAHVDCNSETDGKRVWNVIKQEVEV